jgi:hypothetical protein
MVAPDTILDLKRVKKWQLMVQMATHDSLLEGDPKSFSAIDSARQVDFFSSLLAGWRISLAM